MSNTARCVVHYPATKEPKEAVPKSTAKGMMSHHQHARVFGAASQWSRRGCVAQRMSGSVSSSGDRAFANAQNPTW